MSQNELRGNHRIETRRLIDFVPSAWRINHSSIWVTCYSVFNVRADDFSLGPKIVDFNEVRAVIGYGVITYTEMNQEKKAIITEDGYVNLYVDMKIQERETSEGAYLLLLAPFGENKQPEDEPATRKKISTAAGLLGVFIGRNIVYERLFDTTIKISGEESSWFGSVFDNPGWYAKPDISDARLDLISIADKAITAKPEPERNRISLSLRWFEQALYANGVDAFLKYWIALETLAMPNTTNISLLKECLSRAYNLMPCKNKQDNFSVGNLFGLRSRIVHEGQQVPIHANLLKYIEALYSDALYELLALSCERRAESVMNDPKFDLKKYLHEA